MKVDLTEIATSELVEELEARSIASIICLCMQDSANECTSKFWYTGNDYTKLGMVASAVHRLQGKIESELEHPDGED